MHSVPLHQRPRRTRVTVWGSLRSLLRPDERVAWVLSPSAQREWPGSLSHSCAGRSVGSLRAFINAVTFAGCHIFV